MRRGHMQWFLCREATASVAYLSMKVDLRAKTIGTVMNAEAITFGGSGSGEASPDPQIATRLVNKVLLLAATPRDMTRLALDEEAREITQTLRMSEHRDAWNLITAWAVRPDDILQQLNQHRPRMVHFSGHGSATGALVLSDAQGMSAVVDPAALDALFSALKDDIRLVLLNSCYSLVQAAAISRTIDFVVGMNTTVGDRAAIVFAGAFYRALGFGRSVQQSFEQARVSVMLHGIPEHQTPVLLVRNGASAHELL
jgi:hypothetical protein